MNVRALSIVLLAFASVLMTAIVSAVGIAIAQAFGWPIGLWLAPAALFVSATLTFFLGRHDILPPHLAATWGRAALVIAVWNAMAMIAIALGVLAMQKTRTVGAISGVAVLLAWFVVIVGLGSFLGRAPSVPRQP